MSLACHLPLGLGWVRWTQQEPIKTLLGVGQLHISCRNASIFMHPRYPGKHIAVASQLLILSFVLIFFVRRLVSIRGFRNRVRLLFLAYTVCIDWSAFLGNLWTFKWVSTYICVNYMHIYASTSLHHWTFILQDDVGDASSSLRGSASSCWLRMRLIFYSYFVDRIRSQQKSTHSNEK